MRHMVFHETATLGYTGRFNLLKAIDIRISDDPVKGTLFELKGTSCQYLSGWLRARKETWNDFFKKVLDYGVNFTRVDLALNDRIEILDIPILAKKAKKKNSNLPFILEIFMNLRILLTVILME